MVFLLSVAISTISADQCSTLVSPTKLQNFDETILTQPVVLFGLENFRCTLTAEEALPNKGVCYQKEILTQSDPLLAYLKCVHAADIGPINGPAGKNMEHSYLYVDGHYVGDGFKAATLTNFGHAQTNCGKSKSCASILSPTELNTLEITIKESPVALFGWGGCPCTDIARNRFDNKGVCYMQAVWPDHNEPTFRYLQCMFGEDNHSFIFFKGTFFGNGFQLATSATSETKLQQLLQQAGAQETCIKTGDVGLTDKPIQSCTQSSDGTTTGWTRTGSCNWDPSDGGYHEVCVTMSEKFLESSAQNDANDLRSVVQPGGHWCICAWAFASAVERDPNNMQGIHLECDKTNAKLREVYQHYIDIGEKIQSPSGQTYEASTALAYVNRLCGDDGGSSSSSTVAIQNADGGMARDISSSLSHGESSSVNLINSMNVASVVKAPSSEHQSNGPITFVALMAAVACSLAALVLVMVGKGQGKDHAHAQAQAAPVAGNGSSSAML